MAAEVITRIQMPKKFQGLYQPYRYKAFHGGRGGGKSHSIGAALIQLGTTKPMRIGCYREIQKSLASSSKQLLEDKIELMNLQDFYHCTEKGIEGINGTKFLFGGLRSNPDSVKSTEGLDIAWVEEADRCSQASLDLLTPTVRKPGSQIWFSWNRRNTTDPVDKLFLGGTPPPGSLIQQINWRDNPWFPEVLKEEMLWMKSRDRDLWRHVWEGEPIRRSEAQVFKNWVEDDLDFDIPAGCEPKFGADFGFSKDPTVLVKVYRWGRTLYIAEEAYRVRTEIDDTPALFAGRDESNQPRWENRYGLQGVRGVMKGMITADSARPETISYLRKRGFSIRSSLKGAGSVEEGIRFLQSHDIVVHPSCKHVIQELENYAYKTDPHTEEVLNVLDDKNNHTIDALRYALETDRRMNRKVRIATCSETIQL